MRVAVLADIHGNLPALDAVLRDVAAAGVDAIVLDGDIADGPMPGPTLDRLAQLGDQVIWVRGNSDRDLAAAFDGTFQPSGLATNAPAEYYAWCAARISQAHRDLLAGLPLTVSLDIDGLGAVAFCHGTARDDNEFILVDSPVEHYRAAFAELAEPTVVVGHTHMPFDRLADGRRVINPGASWALLGPDVVLRRTLYDTDAAAAALEAAAPDLPDIGFLAGNVRASASDAEALAAFTETARQQAPKGGAAD
jgi:predicted phosphodiesterase